MERKCSNKNANYIYTHTHNIIWGLTIKDNDTRCKYLSSSAK